MDKDYFIKHLSAETYFRKHLDLKKSGREYVALCCFHPDTKPSMSVNLDKGMFLCRSCGKGGDVLKFHMDKYGVSFKQAMTEIAEEQGITMEKPKLVKSYTYTDADGNKLYEKQRYESSSGKTFKFKSADGYARGVDSVMYNLPMVKDKKCVILVEGEKCADKVIEMGLCGTTLDSGADSKWLPEFTELLKDKNVVLLPDNDEPGKRYMQRVAEQLQKCKVIELPRLKPKGDIADWDGTKEELKELIKKAQLWQPARPYVVGRSIITTVVDNMLFADKSNLGEATGLKDIDDMIGCIRKKSLTVIGGRPSMGKTAFMFSIMLNMMRRDVPCMLFTPETTKEQSVERLLCQINDTSMQDVNLRINHDHNIGEIMNAAVALGDMPFVIDDTGGIQLEWLEERLKLAINEHNIKCVFIDYLQLMNTITKTHGNEASYIGYISRNLKRIAKDNDIPIVLLAQVNRKCEERPNKRPFNSDLKGSGDIEQDADVIMFVYRDEQYHDSHDNKGVAEIIIAKARDGKTGTAKLAFLEESMRFADLYRAG